MIVNGRPLSLVAWALCEMPARGEEGFPAQVRACRSGGAVPGAQLSARRAAGVVDSLAGQGLGQPAWWVVQGRAPGYAPPEQMVTSAPPSPPGSGEPPAICEISPLVSYSGEVRAARPIWGSSGVGLVWLEDGGEVGASWEVTALPQSTSRVNGPLVAEDFPRRGLQ